MAETKTKPTEEHTLGGGCLYIKRLDDIHLPTLKKLLRESVKQAKKAS